MDIADGAKKSDTTMEQKDLKVYLEREANVLLSEATIDFSDEQGFIITGMQRTSCCG